MSYIIILLMTCYKLITAYNKLLPSEYPRHLMGRCEGGFDCDPDGPLNCVPISVVRDCIVDCPNAADEKCGVNARVCDERLGRGCGQCVRKELVDTYCSDHRWKNLCDETSHFRCVSTENCVLPQWLNDGVNDCADGSDEDPCLNRRGICLKGVKSSSLVIPPYPSFATGTLYKKHPGKCSEGEFQCYTVNECIPVAYVLDGTPNCSDNSDEDYCIKFESECQDPKHPCSFNTDKALFSCGCPRGSRRSPEGICSQANLSPNPGDCADLQRHYKHSRSGIFTAYDWKCANPSLCKFDIHCDMQIYGGGWTVIMQRLNMSSGFNRGMEDYQNGFMVDENNFWIGLDRLHHLTSRPQCANELLVRLETSSESRTVLNRYSHFIVCAPALRYRLSLGMLTYSNDVNYMDDLIESRMSPFDVQSKCESGGGWWRRKCGYRGVLTGNSMARGHYPGVTWHNRRISAVQMLIRPRAYIPPNTGLQ